MFHKIVLTLLVIFLSISCSKNKDVEYNPENKINPYEKYQEGLKAFEQGDYFFANKKFTEAELNFKIVEHAAKSAIMGSYALYGINFYDQATENLNRYLRKYPADKNVIYAHYLMALIYFEQMSDEKKDLKPLLQAKEKIDFFISKFPNTDYAIDLKFKKNLIVNQIAAKELYIAKYYVSIQKWVPAINRLKMILNKYQETIYIEEALHRLVEIHYYLGLEDEAKKYAKILGYNFNSSEWFEESYKILNKDYKIVKKNKPKKDQSLFKKIIKKIK